MSQIPHFLRPAIDGANVSVYRPTPMHYDATPSPRPLSLDFRGGPVHLSIWLSPAEFRALAHALLAQADAFDAEQAPVAEPEQVAA